MQKLSALDLQSIVVKARKTTNPKAHAVFEEVGKLVVGEAVLVKNEDWPHKVA